MFLSLAVFSCSKEDNTSNDSLENSPSITGFSPSLGAEGTMVTIIGENFSPNSVNTVVKFGTVLATVDNTTASSIQVLVPEGAKTSKINIIVEGKSVTSTGTFSVLK